MKLLLVILTLPFCLISYSQDNLKQESLLETAKTVSRLAKHTFESKPLQIHRLTSQVEVFFEVYVLLNETEKKHISTNHVLMSKYKKFLTMMFSPPTQPIISPGKAITHHFMQSADSANQMAIISVSQSGDYFVYPVDALSQEVNQKIQALFLNDLIEQSIKKEAEKK